MTDLSSFAGQELVDSAAMREWEEATILTGTPSFTLMQRAGQAVALQAMARFPDRSFLVFAGPGNNGGDGFIAAQCLIAAGRDVTLFRGNEPRQYQHDAAKALAQCQTPVIELDGLEQQLANRPVLIDALFGIGLKRPIQGFYARLIEQVNQSSLPILAIDIPSGIDADTGQVMGIAIKADVTVTFGALKPGHVLYPGRGYSGEIALVDMGLQQRPFNETSPLINAPVALLVSPPTQHKYSRGYLLVLGSEEMPGAAMLAAKAARRVGAGMVAVAAPASTRDLHLGYQPGLVFKVTESPSDFAHHLEDDRITALLLGSGWRIEQCCPYVETALQKNIPLILDGGALHDGLALNQSSGKIALTPHEGEFARQFPELAKRTSKIDRARGASKQTGAVILLKGVDTIIAAPNGKVRVNVNAGPELATAGSGDVLAGMIGGLLSRGLSPFDAARHAAWWHGEVGHKIGQGLIAEDLVEGLRAFR